MAIYVDLDGTLARYGSNQFPKIGDPIPEMMARIRAWLDKGETVVIFTARLCREHANHEEYVEQRDLVKAWLRRHGLPDLHCTAVKGYDAVEIWDDRAIGVIPNTGRRKDGLD